MKEKTAHLDDTFSQIFELEASPVDGQSLWHKDKKLGEIIKKSTKEEKRKKNA